MIRVLVTGGRTYGNRAHVYRTLDALHATLGIACIIHGAARGADALARQWAVSRQIPHIPYPALWGIYEYDAGFMRNTFMLEDSHPDLVVAFPGGNGTADMVTKAEHANVTVFRAEL